MLGGEVLGDGTQKVSQLSKIEEGKSGTICFLSNLKYEPFLYTTAATAVIVDRDFEPKYPHQTTLIKVEKAYTAFAVLLEKYAEIKRSSVLGVENQSFVAPNVKHGEGLYVAAFAYVSAGCELGKNVKIYPNAFLGNNVKVGDNVVIHAGVKIYENTIIGNNCTFFANVVIGGDGFGFAPLEDGSYKTVPQLGNVVIEDNVSVGAGTTIDCATMGSTIIREGVKLDNLVQIAHNVEIGKHTVIAAQTGVAGSTKIGEYCKIGGQVGIGGHIIIPNRTTIGAQSGVNRSWKKEGLYLNGTLATLYKDNLRSMAVYQRLPDLEKRLIELEKKNAQH